MRIITAAALAFTLFGLTACTKPWKEYDYPAWGFAASFRMPPKVTDTPASPKDGTGRTFQLESIQSGRDLVIVVTDASASNKSDQDILTEVPADMIRNVGGTVVSHSDVTTGKVVGREVTIDRGSDPTERVRVFVANHRIYQLITQSPQGADDPEVVQFLNAFHLLG